MLEEPDPTFFEDHDHGKPTREVQVGDDSLGDEANGRKVKMGEIVRHFRPGRWVRWPAQDICQEPTPPQEKKQTRTMFWAPTICAKRWNKSVPRGALHSWQRLMKHYKVRVRTEPGTYPMLDSSHSSSGRTESAMEPSPGPGESGTFGAMVTSCIPLGPG